jgi:hypothetical protein
LHYRFWQAKGLRHNFRPGRKDYAKQATKKRGWCRALSLVSVSYAVGQLAAVDNPPARARRGLGIQTIANEDERISDHNGSNYAMRENGWQ